MTIFLGGSKWNNSTYDAAQSRIFHRRFSTGGWHLAHRLRTGLIALLIGLLCITSGVVQAGLVTPDQKNLNTLAEAMITSEIQISQKLGFDPHQALSFEGSFTDTGWLATLTGNYSGAHVNLSFVGFFDAVSNTGNFTSTGMLGSTTWSGAGSIAYTDTTPDDYEINWVSNAFLAGEEFDAEVKKVYNYKEQDGVVMFTDTGTIQRTKDGKPVGNPLKEDPSKGSFPKPPQKGSGEYVILVENLYALDSTFNAKKEGGIEGVVTTVPEPSSWLMFGAGLVGLLVYRRRCDN